MQNKEKFAFYAAPEGATYYHAEQEHKIKQRLMLSTNIKRKIKYIYMTQWLWVEDKTICQKRENLITHFWQAIKQ